MRIPRECKIESAAADASVSDRLAPIAEPWCFGNPETGEGRVVATDGRILASVDVALDYNDIPGVLPGRALRRARTATPKHNGEARLALRSDMVVDDRGDTCLRDKSVMFPNWQSVFPGPDEPGIEFGINAKLLHNLAKALGKDELRLKFHGENSPVSVKTDDPGRKGLIMPVAAAGERDDNVMVKTQEIRDLAATLKQAHDELTKLRAPEHVVSETARAAERMARYENRIK